MQKTDKLVKKKFDVDEVRNDFPILKRLVNDKPLVYLDNAATTQKPQSVIDALTNYYTYDNANIHRGLYFLSELATEQYENARLKVKEFINAISASEIIFVRGTTEAINLVASSLCRSKYFSEGDEVIVSNMEHHSNIVPWQLIRDRKKINLKVIPINDAGELDLEAFESMISDKTRLVSVVHISNTLGTINPIKKIVEIAHSKNIPVLVDGAQAMSHLKVDVQELDADFYAFSGHKVFGPTGIGVLYGKAEFLEMMPPYQGGGDMIRTVTFEKTTFEDIPKKFEAGTPNIAGGIGLGAAIDYVNQFDRAELSDYEDMLLKYATERLSEIDGLKIIGNAGEKASVISFVIDGIHPYDIGTIIDTDGIAIRTGHHCTQPIMKRFGVPATARASFSFYNTKEEIDKLYEGLLKVKKIFE
ncbi:Cysteine desulfurase SufS [Melioribacter roseus P3M-2]|uniref:Probable cysteine desulfurase n=1 Tax=Melioribacter roseus (strain DSM 23840 / JCM 17771 / VKM B-2668 / P3M-2) TaxID=1191523 RepID=I6Z361_MELRP|nr:cysteine desulfurase [Melioribacter roseus]AFN73585.1 Cysteine desulfurase SufS [Melioribacter roseus P3M-2]